MQKGHILWFNEKDKWPHKDLLTRYEILSSLDTELEQSEEFGSKFLEGYKLRKMPDKGQWVNQPKCCDGKQPRWRNLIRVNHCMMTSVDILSNRKSIFKFQSNKRKTLNCKPWRKETGNRPLSFFIFCGNSQKIKKRKSVESYVHLCPERTG